MAASIAQRGTDDISTRIDVSVLKLRSGAGINTLLIGRVTRSSCGQARLPSTVDRQHARMLGRGGSFRLAPIIVSDVPFRLVRAQAKGNIIVHYNIMSIM